YSVITRAKSLTDRAASERGGCGPRAPTAFPPGTAVWYSRGKAGRGGAPGQGLGQGRQGGGGLLLGGELGGGVGQRRLEAWVRHQVLRPVAQFERVGVDGWRTEIGRRHLGHPGERVRGLQVDADLRAAAGTDARLGDEPGNLRVDFLGITPF